ncbi:hypothetical protein BJ123_102189 [Rhodopseudomonas thermotolerans]|uniref:Uncharacterized protein n=2 Tax=Rhodopseudomonas TaxID=1073 RepID=A0A336JHY6_9BRAD|nr:MULTISPECIES: hypothetical protein [Rhodopseudomonas]RED42018.1 hypothetical protein BJ125_102187 [Rhodopseudomonas pentothenatexigens]REG07479.1 hypothetical protein BJ123_102189 [Rhodopseudomonas thermotolerans]SSW89378.1 hypothetical protein SAMN05892882_102187 [Rhodopseudomonas pentothenatexigens]
MRLQLGVAKLGLAISAVALVVAWPQARHGAAMLAARDDPARLSELQITEALRRDQGLIARQAEAALAAGDADLARSLVELAGAHQVALPEQLTRRVDDAVAAERAPAQVATRFATGLVTGQADDLAGLSGTVAGDLFVFGDVRDVVREGKHLATGEATDHLLLGLAAAGIAVTAATYVSIGAAAPARAGLTLVKDARKVGRISEGLATWAGRSAREMVDTPALRRAVADASLLRPAQTLDAVKAAVRTDKAGGLLRLAKDVGKIGEKAGTRGAFDALKVADNPKEVARAAKLAEAKGGQTRAIIKLLGRGALLLATGAWNFASWIFSALLMLIGFVTSLKAGTERLTQRWLDRRRRKAAKRVLAAETQPQPSVGVASAAVEA